MDGNLLMSSGNETTKNMHYITHPHGENSLQGLLQLRLHNARLYLEVGRGERGGRQSREEGRGRKMNRVEEAGRMERQEHLFQCPSLFAVHDTICFYIN